MKKFLLATLLLFAFAPVFGQAPQRVFVSNGSTGCGETISVWQCNSSWLEALNTYGGSDAAQLSVADLVAGGLKAANDYPGILKTDKTLTGIEVPEIVVIRSGHSVYVSDHVLYSGTVIVEEGATLYFNKPLGDQGRLSMDQLSRIVVKPGGYIKSGSTSNNGLAANHLEMGTEKIKGNLINVIPVPLSITAVINEPFLYCIRDVYQHWTASMTNDQKLATIMTCIQQRPQPVDLLNLSAQAAGNDVVVNWSVANELDFSHYIIEASQDAFNYSTVATVTAKGTQTGTQSYSFRQQSVPAGVYYYRLLAVDVDGTVEQKGNVMVVRLGAEAFSAIAKQGRLMIRYDGPENSMLTLSDSMGRVITAAPLTAGSLETASLRPGIYLVTISNGFEKKTKRVMVQ